MKPDTDTLLITALAVSLAGFAFFLGYTLADTTTPEAQVLDEFCNEQQHSYVYDHRQDTLKHENDSLKIWCSPEPGKTPTHLYTLTIFGNGDNQ